MTNADLTHIYFLLDRSGSMQSILSDTIGGFDAFIAEQRATPGQCRVTLAQFDTEYEEALEAVATGQVDLAVVHNWEPLPLNVPVHMHTRPLGTDVADVPSLVLHPRGMTALHDAMGRLITDAGAGLAALPEEKRPGTVVVAIMTDGLENASREWTGDAIRHLVQQQSTTYNWQFLYMGADQDAVEVGSKLGVAAANSITYGRQNAAVAMAATADMISDVRRARAAGAPAAALRGFSDEERRQSR